MKNDMGNKPVDEQITINVKNEKLEELLHAYQADRTAEKLNAMIVELHKCRLLIPGSMNADKKPVPAYFKDIEGNVFLPVFTQKEQIRQEPKVQMIFNVDFESINKMCIDPALDVKGIVFNPFSDNLIYKKELLLRIAEVDEQRKKALQERKEKLEELQKSGAKVQQVKLTEEQYNMLMRKQFEFTYLPKKFFEEGQNFIDQICDKKEEYIDELFEDSYQEKRMYPLLPEDFAVMIMDISEDLLIVRLDMPERNMIVPSCYRMYLTWNSVEKKGRYFTIEKTKEKDVRLLGEMTVDNKHISIGNAPVEGAELQEIINIQKSVSELTS